jgi:hypothetical protein
MAGPGRDGEKVKTRRGRRKQAHTQLGGPGDPAAQGDPGGQPAGQPQNQIYARIWISLGAPLMVAAALALFAGIVNLWPAVETTTEKAPVHPHVVRLLFGAVSLTLSQSTGLIVLAILAGALGSLVHATTSFGDFVGNERFRSSWIAWYTLRLIVGSLLALLLYFAIRGGFFSGNSQTSSVNPYGIAAFSGLAGLFSKQATDKLREVFETMFRVSPQGGDAQRKDSLTNPHPTVKSIDPDQIAAGAVNQTVHIHGERFVQSVSVVKLDGKEHRPTFVNAQQLDVAVPDELVAVAGTSVAITVYTPPPGGGESAPPVTLSVGPAAPQPQPQPHDE